MIRNYLRAHPNDAREYAQRKKEILEQGVAILLAYSDHKARFMAELLRKAKQRCRAENK